MARDASRRAEARAGFERALGRLAAGEHEAAEAELRAALQADPSLPEAHANLAWLLERRGRLAEAERAYEAALALRPDDPRVLANFGALLARARRAPEALAPLRRAVALDAGASAAWSNLGVALASLRQDEEAEASLRRALRLDPGDTAARFNLGYVLLRQGRYEEGWPCLDARKQAQAVAQQLDCPRWQGEPLAGRRLFVEHEAGHGDVIQFCRYAALLKQRGLAHLALACHPALKPLLGTLEGVDALYGLDEPVPARGWDYWTPLLSVPRYLDTRLESIPARLPYLRADPARVARWAARLPPRPRVGLVWRGNPNFENDAERSLPGLQALAALWSVPGLHFVSLQKGAGEEEAAQPPPGQPLLALGAELGDFADTAAVLAGLDLLVSVDTAVAHLAGALARPCWILLPWYQPDWRWLEDREDSPWYPACVRLFRQPRRGDWAAATESLARALASWSVTAPRA